MRKRVCATTNFAALIEQYAESLLDLAAEERRLMKTLERVRAAKAGVVAGLAKLAAAEAAPRKRKRC